MEGTSLRRFIGRAAGWKARFTGRRGGGTLHRLAAPDLAGFFGSFLPQRIASLDGLDDAQKRAVLWPRADDRPSFIRG